MLALPRTRQYIVIDASKPKGIQQETLLSQFAVVYISKFPKPGRYETGPQKMETSGETLGETPYIKKLKNIYIYI
jgi:hypothetical protein